MSFETRALKTSSRLKDGQTVMLAGFLQSTKSSASDFTPEAHRIPGLGWIFKSKDDQRRELDFVIAITPAIVRDREPRAALWAYPSNTEVLRRLLEPVPPGGRGLANVIEGDCEAGPAPAGGERDGKGSCDEGEPSTAMRHY